jgi:hypothetical protein
MDDSSIISDLKERMIIIEERLLALEIEQRRIMEDILSGHSMEHMRMRILEKPNDKKSEKGKVIEKSKIGI